MSVQERTGTDPAPEPPAPPSVQEELEQMELDGGKIIKPSAPETPVTSKVKGIYNAGAFDVVVEEIRFGTDQRDFFDLAVGNVRLATIPSMTPPITSWASASTTISLPRRWIR